MVIMCDIFISKLIFQLFFKDYHLFNNLLFQMSLIYPHSAEYVILIQGPAISLKPRLHLQLISSPQIM